MKQVSSKAWMVFYISPGKHRIHITVWAKNVALAMHKCAVLVPGITVDDVFAVISEEEYNHAYGMGTAHKVEADAVSKQLKLGILQ